ncbi:MAG TPA: hypothetical protein VKB87_23825 [Myxococcaceae bacterium]|nr:hypothetical protein [Myxococcaceae bacterium]
MSGKSTRAVGRLHIPDRQCRIRDVRADERLRSRPACEQSAHFDGRAAEIGPPDGPRATILFSAGLYLALAAAPYSPSYGEVQPAGVLVYSVDVEQGAVLTFVVLFCDRRSRNPAFAGGSAPKA